MAERLYVFEFNDLKLIEDRKRDVQNKYDEKQKKTIAIRSADRSEQR